VKTISVVTPCFNEESSIAECVKTVRTLFDEQLPGFNLEHIVCDNCSTDRSVEILREMIKNNPGLRVIVNSRNFGILKNTYNGVMAATGDAVLLFLPVDLQDPPELIPEMVGLWVSGYEIVFGIRAQREEHALMRFTRKAYYRLLSRLTYVDYPPDAGDFQLVDRVVVNAMKRIDDAQPFMRLMTFDCGFRSVGLKYKWKARKHGKSRNSFSQLFDQGMNGIISFSGAPIRLAQFVGGLISLLSMMYAMIIVVLKLTGYVNSVPGMSTLIVAIFFFGGIQLLFIGLVGEYILAIFNQVRRRPLVIERERINFAGAPAD
jgi:glycosyltransferase involved in cell wall biosynthesis